MEQLSGRFWVGNPVVLFFYVQQQFLDMILAKVLHIHHKSFLNKKESYLTSIPQLQHLEQPLEGRNTKRSERKVTLKAHSNKNLPTDTH